MPDIRSDRRPLDLQVRDKVRSLLRRKGYRPGDRIPSEQELTSLFGVSRATVREALRSLEEERRIVCRHGCGRFVAPDTSPVFREEITRLKSVTEMMRDLGIEVRGRTLSWREEPAGPDIRERLGLAAGEKVRVLERVRMAKGEALIYSADIFPASLVTAPRPGRTFRGSLARVMEERWGVRLAYSRATIRAAFLPPRVASRLGLGAGLPWLLLEQVNYDSRDKPVLFSRDYHRSDKIDFYVLRRRR